MSQADEPFNLEDLMGTGGEWSGQTAGAGEAVGVPPVATAESGVAKVEKPPKPSLRERLRSVDIFTIMLGLSLLAIVIAVILLAIELSRYQWDTSARSARQSVLAPSGIQSEMVKMA